MSIFWSQNMIFNMIFLNDSKYSNTCRITIIMGIKIKYTIIIINAIIHTIYVLQLWSLLTVIQQLSINTSINTEKPTFKCECNTEVYTDYCEENSMCIWLPTAIQEHATSVYISNIWQTVCIVNFDFLSMDVNHTPLSWCVKGMYCLVEPTGSPSYFLIVKLTNLVI